MKRTIANILRSLASRLDPPPEQGWIYVNGRPQVSGVSSFANVRVTTTPPR